MLDIDRGRDGASESDQKAYLLVPARLLLPF